MDSETKNYEIAYLINPDVAEDEVFGEAGKITGFVQDARGLVGHIEEPRKRRLAYPIEEFKQAYFGWTTFAIIPSELPELKKKIKAEKNMVRFVVSEEVKKAPFLARSMRARHAVPQANLEEIKPFEPQAPKEEDKVKIEELDKRLEEILGK
jgi:small subunit ribosomal protein S6